MDIQGNGMLARAFAAIDVIDDSLTVFAKGVADSRTTAAAEFEREARELEQTIDSCQAVGRTLIYLSGGGSIYGRRETVRFEDDAVVPESPYGRHQVACEQAIVASGVEHLIARIPNAVGYPQRPAQLIPALVQQVRDGRVSINTNASRDLIDAADVAAIVTALATAGVRDRTINVASGMSTAIEDIVGQIESLLGTTAEREIRDDRPDPQRFSIARLQGYLPWWSPAATYPFEVLARYVRVSALDHA